MTSGLAEIEVQSMSIGNEKEIQVYLLLKAASQDCWMMCAKADVRGNH